LHLLRGNGPLGPISRRLQGRRLTRHSQPGSTSRFRRFEPRIARHRLAAMPLTFQSSVIRVTRTAGGWTRVLASSASVRRSVMRALLPREPALRPTPSTEPARCLDARAPVGSTPFDVCHADPPRVVTAGRAFTTNDPPTSDVPLSLAGTPNRHHPVRARRTRRSRDRARLRRRCYHRRLIQKTACATFQKLRFRRLSTTSPKNTCSPGPHLRHRGETMT
jgi:hypothetical protein